MGRRFSLPQGQRLRFPVLRGDVPLLVGTWAPRLSAFAGEEAHELKVGGSANPEVVPIIRERIGNPDVRIVLGAVTVVDDDGERARRIARREVAMYLAVVAELDPTVSLEPELMAYIRSLVAAGDDEGAGAVISDDILDRFAFAGTPEQIAAHAEVLFEAGVGRIDFGTPHGVPERRGVELLCAEVLPRLRPAVGADL
jgi:5,10-methylenetetrahydromethanopterin reductase